MEKETIPVHYVGLNREWTTHCTIGKDVDVETVSQMRDPSTGCLFAIHLFVEGKPETLFMKKELWDLHKNFLDGKISEEKYRTLRDELMNPNGLKKKPSFIGSLREKILGRQ